MTRPMTQDERDEFLREPRPGVLAIPVAGRGPLCSPVWFDFKPGGSFWILMQDNSRKGRLIQVGTWISLCVQQDARPYRYVTAEGPVTEIAPYGLETDLRAMADRYLGTDGGAEFVANMGASYGQGHGVKVTMDPKHWLSADYDKD